MAFVFVPATDEITNFVADITLDGKPFTFKVPLMQFVDRKRFKQFRDWAGEHPDNELIKVGQRPVEEAFDELMRILKPEGHKQLVDKLVYGEKLQLWEEWMRLSDMPVGELLDSTN